MLTGAQFDALSKAGASRKSGGGDLNVTVTANPGLAKEYAQLVARQTTTRLQDALALHQITGLAVGV